MNTKTLIFSILLILSGLCPQSQAATYMSTKDFVSLSFKDETNLKPQTLWLTEDIQKQIREILNHPYPKLRLKYWQKDQQSVWILEKIGKERPITFGISIIDNKVDDIRVLAFRESRGYEIRYQAFTDQFDQIGLTPEGKLDQDIDGITGATMSVNAMKKITRLALMLAKLVNQ